MMLPLPTGQHVVSLAQVFVVLRKMRLGLVLIPDIECLLGLFLELNGTAKTDTLFMKRDAGAGQNRRAIRDLAGGAEILVEL